MDWLRRLFGGGRPAEHETTAPPRARSRRPSPSAPLPDGMAGVVAALEQGRKIEAIRRYREERPRIGLAEAKAAVEALERDMRTAAPSVARMELLREAALTLAAACRVQAIARHRQLHPGVGLAEARAAVAALEGQPGRLDGPAPVASPGAATLASAPLAAAQPPVAPPPSNGDAGAPAMPAEVEAMVRAGRTIEAVMAYREHNPAAGLGEAMDAVSALERRLRGDAGPG
jgi:ribosomal protein L7/L12